MSHRPGHTRQTSDMSFAQRGPSRAGSAQTDIEATTPGVEEKDKGSDAQISNYSGDGEGEQGLHRKLSARQIQMIALGGAIGTGLVIGTGTAITRAGPAGTLIGYVVMGLVCFSVLSSLGEMAAYLPIQQGFTGYAARYVDPALGVGLGYNYLFKYLIVTPNNITAASIVIRYWTEAVPIAALISIFIALILIINFWGVKAFGVLEFWFSLIKVVFIALLLVAGLVVDLGGNPAGDRIGFRYWKDPGAFSHYIFQNDLGTFLGFWSVFAQALFAYIGTELIGVCVGETENPSRNISRAIKRTFWRIVIFYVGGALIIGMLVPSDNGSLIGATKASTGAGASPFTIAFQLAGIRGFAHFINAVVFVCTLSAANSDLYIASRTMFGLAAEGKAPAIFKWTDRRGVPVFSVAFGAAFCCLAYLNVAQSSKKVFGYFVSLVTVFGALTWMSLSFCHIRFMRALEVQGISRDTLPYKSPFQPYSAWIALIFTTIVTLFKGFDAFTPRFKVDSFVTNYIGIPLYIIIYFGYKFAYKTKIVPLNQIDLHTGRQAFVEQAAMYDEKEKAEKAIRYRGWKGYLWRVWDLLA